MLSGRFDCSIDSKNRLSIPLAVRRMLNADAGRSYYVVPGRKPGTLSIYPDRYYESEVQPRLPKGRDLSDDAYEWIQFLSSQTVLLEEDGQGRILIPEWLMARAGISRDATLIGVDDHLELWDRRGYESWLDGLWPQYATKRARAAVEIAESAAPSTWKASAASGPGGSE